MHPSRRARVRLEGLPPSSEREVDFVYQPEFGRYCSDAIVAVSRGRHGREVYAAALGVPAGEFADAMRLDPSHIRRFRGLTASIVAWAERPELGWRGFTPTADRSLWDPDWVQAAQGDTPPSIPVPTRPAYLPGDRLAAAIRHLVSDPHLGDELAARARERGYHAGDWLRGGCLILAEGARRAFGGELVGVIDDADCSCGDRDAHGVEHIALRLRDGRCLDATGLYPDADALLANLAALGYRAPSLCPFRLADRGAFGIPFDADLAIRLAHRLRLELD